VELSGFEPLTGSCRPDRRFLLGREEFEAGGAGVPGTEELLPLAIKLLLAPPEDPLLLFGLGEDASNWASKLPHSPGSMRSRVATRPVGPTPAAATRRHLIDQKSTKKSYGRVSGTLGTRRTAHWCSGWTGETSSNDQLRFVTQKDTTCATAGSW
jgi:hypothetical protein